jgi:dsDNA-binding SOS-regulon protein
MKAVKPATPTKEEQAKRVSMYLAQKKEQLFQGCLFALLSNPKCYDNDPNVILEEAEMYADEALKKMYNLDEKEGE